MTMAKSGGRSSGFKITVTAGVAIVIALGVLFFVYYDNIEPAYVPPPTIPTEQPPTGDVGTPGGPTTTGRDLSPEELAKIDAVMKITKTEFATFRLLSGGPADPVWNSLSEQMRLMMKGKIEGVEGVAGAGVDSMPGTGIINIQKITEEVREAECGFTFSFLAKAAMKGEDPFKERHTSIQGIANLYEQGLHFIVRADSPLETVGDIKGKDIKLATSLSGEIDNMVTQWVLGEYGISYSGIESAGGAVEHYYFDLGLMNLQDGSLDAISYFAPVGSKELTKFLEMNSGYKILRIEGDVLKSLEDKRHLSAIVIPAGTYKGMNENIRTIGSNAIFVCTTDLSNDAVGKVSSLLIDNLDHLAKDRPEVAMLKPDKAWMDTGIEMHPGAVMYYMGDCMTGDGDPCMVKDIEAVAPGQDDRDLSPEEKAKIEAVMKITKTEFATFRLLSGGPADPVWNSLSEQMRLMMKGKIEGVEGVAGAGVDSMPGTGIINIQKITEEVREAECGFTFSFLAKAALKGSDPFKEKRTSIEGIANLYEQGLHFIVRADSPLETVGDIKGKDIKLATSLSGEIDNMVTQWVLGEYGISYSSIESAGGTVEHSYLDLGLRHLQQGSIDAASYFISVGNKELKAFLEENTDYKLLSVDDNVIKSLGSMGLMAVNIPAGTYAGTDEDVTTIGSNTIFICTTDLSIGAVEKVSSLLLDNLDHLAKDRPEVANLTLKEAMMGIGISMHPGAEVYYQKAMTM